MDEDCAEKILKTLPLSEDMLKLVCALLWWCEGNKDDSQVRFTNFDPTLIQNFLISLRRGFQVEESKFRVLMHLHDYHKEEEQRSFWSKITKIPSTQFYKSYHKDHTSKRLHENYQGCIAIGYYDARIAKQLHSLYNAYTVLQGGVR